MRISHAISAALLVLACAASCRAAAYALTISLKEQASSVGPYIKLSEVAGVAGDETLAAKARDVLLGRTPETARAKTLDSGYVSERLQVIGISRQDFTFAGVKNVTVSNSKFAPVESTPATMSVEKTEAEAKTAAPQPENPVPAPVAVNDRAAGDAKSDVVQIACEEIAGMVAIDLKLKPQDIKIEEISRNAALRRLPAGVQRLKDVIPADNGAVLGKRAFTLVVKVGEEEFSDLVLKVHVNRMADVVVASRALTAKTAITAADVRVERRPFDSRSDNYFTKIEDVLGMAPVSAVLADEVLVPGDVKPAVLVNRGDAIKAHAGVAKFDAEALDSGAVGDSVRVRRTVVAEGGGDKSSSGKARSVVLLGRVMSDGTVSIQ